MEDYENNPRGIVEVSVEVLGSAGRSRVRVRAESIEQAVRLAKSRYAVEEARVLFPIEPEAFFVDAPLRARVRA
jgi:hypothetical protein